MKVVHVIHRFPPFYMAGSEIYTYNLTEELSKYIDVYVFTRYENPFEPPYSYIDEVFGKVKVRRINRPFREYTFRDKYIDINVERLFREYMDQVKPDIVHIQHLSHLSTNIIDLVKDEYGIPILFTLHDFWMLCFRGQLTDPLFNRCTGPSPERCLRCARFFFKNTVDIVDIDYYRRHMNRILGRVDLFLSPSKFLMNMFIRHGIPKNKIVYSRYGFRKDLIKYKDRKHSSGSIIRFGFIGRIVPTKGVHILLKAFNRMRNKNARLLVFGYYGNLLSYLKRYANERVYFMGGFHNREIDKILDQIDVLVVPSIWYENSPLVIQEAFLAGIPVIASNIGGMAELVKDRINGFTFKVGDIDDLAEKMDYIADNPEILNDIRPSRDSVRSIEDDAKSTLEIYRKLVGDTNASV